MLTSDLRAIRNPKSRKATKDATSPIITVVSSPWSRSPLDQPCGEANKFHKCATSPLTGDFPAGGHGGGIELIEERPPLDALEK